jgi:hypothetical protein
MKIIIDNRMRKIEKEYLSSFGKLIELPKFDQLYDEISSHPDIFITKVDDKIICAPCIKDLLEPKISNLIIGEKNPKLPYPNDIYYNVCIFGNYAIGNFEHVDKRVLNTIDETNKIKINVKQGYSNCSCRPINENALITSDKGIYDECIKYSIDVLYLEPDSIKLLDSNNHFSNMKGFIGGATCIIDNTFILFGSLEFLGDKNIVKLLEFLDKYNMKIKDFPDCEIIDYGGIQFT